LQKQLKAVKVPISPQKDELVVKQLVRLFLLYRFYRNIGLWRPIASIPKNANNEQYIPFIWLGKNKEQTSLTSFIYKGKKFGKNT
jgi:hypothetical protein